MALARKAISDAPYLPSRSVQAVSIVTARLAVAVVPDADATRAQVASVTRVAGGARVAGVARTRVASGTVRAGAVAAARRVEAVVGDAAASRASVACNTHPCKPFAEDVAHTRGHSKTA